MDERGWECGARGPDWHHLLNFPTIHPFSISCLTIYVQSIFHDSPLASKTGPWIYIFQQQLLKQQTFTSPIHSKTQHQASPETPVAVLTLTGLEKTLTTHGVPLFSMGKTKPPRVLLKLQKSLHKANSTPVGFLLRTQKTSYRYQAYPFKEGISVALTAYLQDTKCFHIILNLQKNQRLVVHHRMQLLDYSVLLNLHCKTQPL